MLRLRVVVPAGLTPRVLDVLDSPAVSSVQLWRGASRIPEGDVVEADVSREGSDALVEQLCGLGVGRVGSLNLEDVGTWLSEAAERSDARVPGASADAVVWPAVEHQAMDDTEVNWTFLSFMILATVIAAVAIVTDSGILVIGAMVLGPEFGAVAALSLGLLLRRPSLLGRAATALGVGFAAAFVFTALSGLLARWVGWVEPRHLLANRAATSFIFHPDHWSLVVAVVAGAAGVLAMTSQRTGGMSGVFISVTTIPALANMALAAALGVPGEFLGSCLQLALNILGMVLAGWFTLLVQQRVRRRVPVGGRGPARGRS